MWPPGWGPGGSPPKCSWNGWILRSLWHPFWLHFSQKIVSKSMKKSGLIFKTFLDANMLSKCSWNPHKIHINFNRKIGWIFVWFLDCFWLTFGGVLGSLDPPKWVSRPGEVLLFRKSCSPHQIWFWIDFGVILGRVSPPWHAPLAAPAIVGSTPCRCSCSGRVFSNQAILG